MNKKQKGKVKFYRLNKKLGIESNYFFPKSKHEFEEKLSTRFSKSLVEKVFRKKYKQNQRFKNRINKSKLKTIKRTISKKQSFEVIDFNYSHRKKKPTTTIKSKSQKTRIITDTELHLKSMLQNETDIGQSVERVEIVEPEIIVSEMFEQQQLTESDECMLKHLTALLERMPDCLL